MADLLDLADILGNLRYGMPTSQKEALAISGTLPGAPKDMTADQTAANRYAAGYLFTRRHPDLAQYAIPAASFIHGLFGDNEAIQSQAHAGMNEALKERK